MSKLWSSVGYEIKRGEVRLTKIKILIVMVMIIGVMGTMVLIMEKPTPKEELEKILFAVHGRIMETADHEEAYRLLVEHGQFYHIPVRFIEGPPHKCFVSSERYFLEHPGSELYIGYVFSRDRWWFHYWVLDDGLIIEFTVEREHYYGMALGVWES